MKIRREITFLSSYFVKSLLIIILPFAATSRSLDTFGQRPNLIGLPAPYRFANYCLPGETELWTVGGQGSVLLMRKDIPTRRFKLESAHYNGDLYGVYFNNQGVGWVVGDSGVIFHTPNYGDTWIEQSIGGKDDLNAITCTDNNTCWAVGENGLLLRTADEGKVWKRSLIDRLGDLNAVEFIDNKTGWVVGDNGVVLRTKDGGVTWDRRQVPLSCEPQCDKWGTPLLSVKFVNDQLGWVASREQIARTMNGGETWEIITFEDKEPVVSVVGLISHDGKKVWAVNDGDYNYFSKNSGRTWQKYTMTEITQRR